VKQNENKNHKFIMSGFSYDDDDDNVDDDDDDGLPSALLSSLLTVSTARGLVFSSLFEYG
jgi:hypothetical protein